MVHISYFSTLAECNSLYSLIFVPLGPKLFRRWRSGAEVKYQEDDDAFYLDALFYVVRFLELPYVE